MIESKAQRITNWMLENPMKWALPLIVLSPIVVNLLVRNWHFPSAGDDSAWIGFWGNYLGGAFTMLAFVFTLSYDRNRNNKEILNKRIDADLNHKSEYIELMQDMINYQELYDAKKDDGNYWSELVTNLNTYQKSLKHFYAILETNELRSETLELIKECGDLVRILKSKGDNMIKFNIEFEEFALSAIVCASTMRNLHEKRL